MRNPFLLHMLFFMQLQWLSVIAGILFSYFQNIETAPKKQWLMTLSAITPLLLIQALCTVLLISQMICGHFINAILQGFGGITFFTIGAFSYYWLPRRPLLCHIASGGLLGGLILFGWQRVLVHRYWSVEWCMLFFARCIFLIVLATTFKVAFWYWGDFKNRMHQKQHQILNLIGVGLWYILLDYRLLFFSDSIRLWDLIPARLSDAWPATNPDCFIRRELKRDSTMKDDESLNPDNTFCQAQVDVQKMIDQLKEQSESPEDDE